MLFIHQSLFARCSAPLRSNFPLRTETILSIAQLSSVKVIIIVSCVHVLIRLPKDCSAVSPRWSFIEDLTYLTLIVGRSWKQSTASNNGQRYIHHVCSYIGIVGHEKNSMRHRAAGLNSGWNTFEGIKGSGRRRWAALSIVIGSVDIHAEC